MLLGSAPCPVFSLCPEVGAEESPPFEISAAGDRMPDPPEA